MYTFLISALVGTVISAMWGFYINPKLEKRKKHAVFVEPLNKYEKTKSAPK